MYLLRWYPCPDSPVRHAPAYALEELSGSNVDTRIVAFSNLLIKISVAERNPEVLLLLDHLFGPLYDPPRYLLVDFVRIQDSFCAQNRKELREALRLLLRFLFVLRTQHSVHFSPRLEDEGSTHRSRCTRRFEFKMLIWSE